MNAQSVLINPFINSTAFAQHICVKR